jgi:hypothetical protein
MAQERSLMWPPGKHAVTVAVRPGRLNGFDGLRRAIRTCNAGAGGVGVTAVTATINTTVIVTVAVRLSRLDGIDGLSRAARTWSVGAGGVGVSGGNSDDPRRLTPPQRGWRGRPGRRRLG